MTVQEMITFMVKQLLECALFSKTKEGFFEGLSVKIGSTKLSVIMLKSCSFIHITEICH